MRAYQSNLDFAHRLRPFYDAAILRDHPVAYWAMDDVVGSTIARDIVNGNNGTATNVTFGGVGAVFGEKGTAGVFGGSPSKAQTSSAVNVNSEFTTEIWCKFNSTAANQHFCEHHLWQFFFWWNADRRIFLGWNDGSFKDHAIAWTPTIGKWHHAVAVCGTSTVSFYIDGGSIGSVARQGTRPATTGSSMYIGSNSSSGNNFNGSLQKLAIYSYALSPHQIANHYRIAKSPVLNRRTFSPSSSPTFRRTIQTRAGSRGVFAA